MGRPRKQTDEEAVQEGEPVATPTQGPEPAPNIAEAAGDQAAAEEAVVEATEPAIAEEAPPPVERAPKRRRPRAERKPKAKAKRDKPVERKPIARLPKPEHPRGRRKERRGVVVSNAMDKTIVVRVDTVRPDPRYKKVVRRSVKFHAHDEQNAANVGDVVRIVETRPLARTKNWRLAEIVEQAR